MSVYKHSTSGGEAPLSRRILAEAVRLSNHGNGYIARPTGSGPYPGVVFIHHVTGLDEGSREITRRFADHGYLVVAPNLYAHDAPEASFEEAGVIGRGIGAPPDDRIVADVNAAIVALASWPEWNGRVGIVGFCSGGRQAYLAAGRTHVDAAVVCYGGRIVARTALITDGNPSAPIEVTADIGCPVLGVSGQHDTNPSPSDIEEIEQRLQECGVEHEFVVFEDAGHAFLDAYRDTYRPMAGIAAWEKIFAFLDERLNWQS